MEGFLQGLSDKFKKIGTEYDPASVKEAKIRELNVIDEILLIWK